MIVLDASVAIDLLLDIPPWGDRVAERVRLAAPDVAAPHLLDAEVGQVLRRFTLAGRITVGRALGAVEDLAGLPITRYEHRPLLPRALEFRENLTVYDALNLALAEVLGAVLLTRDEGLASVARLHVATEALA